MASSFELNFSLQPISLPFSRPPTFHLSPPIRSLSLALRSYNGRDAMNRDGYTTNRHVLQLMSRRLCGEGCMFS